MDRGIGPRQALDVANFKNRRPKPYKGCCGMCCLQTTDGRRNHRVPTMQERRATVSEREQRTWATTSR